jgi:hypothetical protein
MGMVERFYICDKCNVYWREATGLFKSDTIRCSSCKQKCNPVSEEIANWIEHQPLDPED